MNKLLNKDWKLVETDFGLYDISMKDYPCDSKIVSGKESLLNACILSLLTRYQELDEIPTYEDYGDRAYELIKANQNKFTEFMIEQYSKNVLNNIRRIKSVDKVTVTSSNEGYYIHYRITSITDEIIEDGVNLT